MKLEQLMEGVPYTLVQGSPETEINDIIYDSRKAAPGLLFVCIVGTQRDSHEFAADCAAKGVSALVIQHDIDLTAVPGVTVVKVESSRYAMALMSANLFGNPSRKMTMIGVTGTKGKTTTTHMIKSVLEAAGRKVGMIGTNGIYYMGRHKDTANTTPESYELQKTFREFLDAGCDTALMEVSSQGLMMDRVAGVHYDVGVFTNLSPDHIGPGEHKTFEEYRSWKGQLFRRCDVGVVNIDDENTEALLEAMEERQITVDGVTSRLAEPFMVLATQNPLESFGTFPLPDAQMDRFFMRLSLGYMTREQELEVLSRPSAQTVLNELQAVVTPEETTYVRTAYREVKVSEEVKHYLMDIVEATRTQSGFVSGVSTRGALALYQAAQAYASLQGREYVIPEDIKGLAPAVLSHRISLGSSMNAEAAALRMRKLLAEITVPLESAE